MPDIKIVSSEIEVTLKVIGGERKAADSALPAVRGCKTL